MSEQNHSGSPTWLRVACGLALTFGLAYLAWLIKKSIYGATLPFGISGSTLEYPIWAALLGIALNLILRLFKGDDYIRPGVKTEFFLKIGLVLLGAGINLKLLVTAAGIRIIIGSATRMTRAIT